MVQKKKEKEKEVIIELSEVWKIFQLGEVKVEAVRGLNIKIHKGDFVAIMGPSGSGKSTAMHMIGALDLPTKGHIYLDGQDISQMQESDLAQIRGKKIGFVFQTFNLLNELTAVENVGIPMMFQGIDRKTRLKRGKELMQLFELGDRLYHRPTELSGGQRQRIAMARALSNDPEIILADEPTGNLDFKTGTEVMKLLTKLYKEQKKTIIVVTHDPYVAKFAKKVYNLLDGRVVSTGLKG